MEVLLDSSFIISCVRDKIDFISQLEEEGFKVKLPHEVFEEMKDLRKRSSISHEDRIAINAAFELIAKRKLKKFKLGGKSVDKSLIELGRKGYYIASLDGAIKHHVPRRIVIDHAKKQVMAELD